MTDLPRPGSDAAASDPGAAADAAPVPAARRVLVTGAGGKTGQAVIGALLARGVDAVGLVRRDEDGRRLRDALATATSDRTSSSTPTSTRISTSTRASTGDRVAGDGGDRGSMSWVVGDQRRTPDLVAAAAGCDAAYAIAPNMTPDETVMGQALIEACAVVGIDRVVYHSVLDPDEPAMPHHHDKARVEAMLVGVDGLAWTVVRPNAYQQNLAGYLASFRAGVYEVPYDLDLPHAPVDLAEVAEVAADCLAAGRGAGRALELSGPELLTARDIARIAGELLDREVVARRIDPDEWAAANDAIPAETRHRLHAMFAHYDRHGFPGDPAPLRTLLGREPTHLRDTLAALLR